MMLSPRITRRKALLGGAGTLAAIAGGRAAFATLAMEQGLRFETRAGVAFGTTIALILAGNSQRQLEAALDAGFVAIRTVENASSVYRPDSDISRLNRDGHVDDPHPHLVTQLRYAETMSRETDGRFDVTVQPLWDLWAAFHARGERPTPADLHPVLDRVGWRGVRIEPHRISFERPDMAATLNSLNQSYAADVVMSAIAAHGIEHAMIDTGEFGAIGHHPDGRGWRLGVVDPRDNEQLAFTLDPFRRFAATSGDYKTFFSPDFKDHHIFDPRTGYSPPTWSQITVLAPSGLEANGLATALFTLDEDEARALLFHHPHCTARCFAKDGHEVAILSGSA